jgi:hypothetical protein
VLDVERMGKRVVENNVETLSQAQADSWHEQMTTELARLRPNRVLVLSIDPLQDAHVTRS